MSRKMHVSVLCLSLVISATFAATATARQADRIGQLRASIEQQLKSRAAAVRSDPERVRQHMIELVSTLPDLVPGNEGYARRMATLRAKLENLTPEQTALLANVDDESFVPALEGLERTAAQRHETFAVLSLKPTTDIVGPASHPLLADSAIYDTLCNSTPNDANTEHNEIIAINVANIAAIVGDVACNSIVVILGEGTNLPACIVAGVLHEVAEGVQFALDLQSFCDGDIAGEENHATFSNLYHVHNDLMNSVANDDQNKTAVITDIDSKSAALATQLNTGTTAILNDIDSKSAALSTQLTNSTTTIVNNANANTTTIVNNDNANRTQIINNSNANRDAMIAELRVVGCELDRLLNTPEGQRSSVITSCSGQPGFPYKFSGARSIAPNPQAESISTPSTSRGQDGVPILPMMGTVTMETVLLDGKMIPSYYLPLSRGGMIEQVQSLVWSTINTQLDLNIALEQTEQARLIAREADQLLTQQRFVEAYRKFAAAYQRLVAPAAQPMEASRGSR